ncbi:type II toxin-antitoxin system VapC family toxin [Crocosphaera chwakensis]|uniref:Cytosine deaminase n=1 Tax=Crocosphaera chwakensis CCY0110 TaxID=391612 RepID=A3ITT1_9CHRO|nr:type II toxin-antitoxin system VapC family toxin [Crocosphaera chwakensis]EAZ90147.1 cytosine deaminase [Crocosphaera chwakensis CCY0110]
MNYLLDTHTLLWWLDESSMLSIQATAIISNTQNIIFVSAISAWEISIKKSLGKLEAPDNRHLQKSIT